MAGLEAWVSGRTQGVWFRGFVRDRARELALTGHVENLPDGRVHVVAYGPAEALDTLVHALHEGPPLARVDGVELGPHTPPVPMPSGFAIHH